MTVFPIFWQTSPTLIQKKIFESQFSKKEKGEMQKRTMFENHRKSLIFQHCEFLKIDACGQTMFQTSQF